MPLPSWLTRTRHAIKRGVGRGGPALSFGLPFLLFMVGGSFALSQFTQLTTREVLDLEGDERLSDLKREYEDMLKSVDTAQWDQKRIDRPWELPATESVPSQPMLGRSGRGGGTSGSR